MPASYTHQCFGDDVLPRLSTMIQRIISSHKDYYDLGLQGPDLFFYYHPTRKTMVRDFGLSLHKENAYSFFEEKIAYLSKYFKFDIYHLFVDTILLWNEEGGDILKMSRYLIDQARLKEEYLLRCESMHKTKTIEFVILWSIALSILAVLRFALSQFFSYILHTIVYQTAIVIIMLFALFSVYLLVMRVTNLELEGWKDEEK